MAHSLPVKVRRTEFASSDPDELREVIDRGFGSRLQLAVPRRRGWRATVSPASRTVTAIAYRWDFSNASRFATRYQEAYGVRPSQTLRQD